MSAAASFPWYPAPAEHTETGFRSIFEHASIPAAYIDAQGIIIEVNPAFDQVLEWKKSTNALRLSDLVATEGHEAAASFLRALQAGTCAGARIKSKTFNSEIADWTIWPAAAPDGKPARAVLLADFPPQAVSQSRDSLQSHRWESVGRLTGGVAHDFNNLLTGVTLYCDLLLSSLDSDNRQLRRYAEEIRSAIAQAGGLIQQLLVFARPRPAESHIVSVNHIVESMHDLLKRLIGENIQLEFQLDPALAPVEIEPNQLEQVLLNLILNSRDALPEGGRIQVETSNCKFQSLGGSSSFAFPCVLLAVSDNGCGMNAEIRRHLFDPFFTTKPPGKGTGLGLTTIRSIVAHHRGLIHIESEPSRGTRVMILLPQHSKNTNFPHLAPSPSNSHATTLQEEKKEPHL
jgi:two-component system, cell cycle sensor histidine kinase and response regulator CckA